MTAPARLTLVVDNSVSCPQDAGQGGQKSCPKVLDPYRLRSEFCDLWAGYLKARFRRVEDVAEFFDVRFQIACNWWNAANRPSGDKVTLAVLSDPQGYADHMAQAMGPGRDMRAVA